MMYHISIPKKTKARKPTAKQRELSKSWSDLIKKYEPKKPLVKTVDAGFSYSLGAPAGRETPRAPSRSTAGGNASWRPNPVYTGDKVKGIGTMHKSNAVPVFSDEEAHDIATMRRG
jgi:hypothetical protein